jgi:hypothetical protein
MVRHRSVVGLIGAALGTLLCATGARAQQITSGLCFFDNTGGSLPGPTCNAYSVQLDDKLFTVVSAPSSGVGKVAWETSPPLPAMPDLWQVAIDWEASGLAGPVQGDFSYTVQILGGSGSFASIGLSTAGDYPSAGIDSTVIKDVYQGLDDSGLLADSVTSVDGSSNVSSPIGGTQIFVRDTWDVTDGATLDNVSNYIRQNEVPGPLPVLGALSALAMARRLRARLT